MGCIGPAHLPKENHLLSIQTVAPYKKFPQRLFFGLTFSVPARAHV